MTERIRTAEQAPSDEVVYGGPTIYRQLMDRAASEPVLQLQESMRDVFLGVERKLAERLAAHLRQAYLEGVRDGFHEGLAAADRAARGGVS